MKKLFFFRNSTDKQVNLENSPNEQRNQGNKRDEYSSGSLRTSLFKSQNHTSENQGLDTGACLRRSRSFSSAGFMNNATAQRNLSCLSDHTDPSSSPCSSNSSVNAQENIRSSRGRTLTPERHVKASRSTGPPLETDYVGGKPLTSHSSRFYRDASENSSLSSSSVSNEVLDLYIDGEQHHGRRSPMKKTLLKEHSKHGGGKKPPKIKCTAPASSTGRDSPRPHSFRGSGVSEHNPSSREWIETGSGHGSPKELAKHVVEKLCQTRTSSREFDSDVPITIQDVYGESLNINRTSKSDTGFRGGFEKGHTSTNASYASFSVDTEDELDVELKSNIRFLSEELDREAFLSDVEFNVPSLVRRVKELTEEKKNSLQGHLTDRAFMKAKFRSLSIELESRTRKLQNDNNDIQSAMEKELDRRSNDWSLKVETFQAEEMRLRERVRELAEQNVSLQREVSSLSELKSDRQHMEKQVDDLSSMLEAVQAENQHLQQSMCDLQDKYKVADEDRVYIQRNYGEKEEECKELHACVSRLMRTCSDQEKTIDMLRGELTESVQKKHPMENSDRRVQKLQLEQIRLTGVEQVLRREVESYKTEVDALRHENINLLNRLRGCGSDGGVLTLKLDEELRDRLDLLQKEALSMLNENTRLCSKLLECLKRLSRNVGKESTEVDRCCLDGQFIMESDIKVQGFRRGTEVLIRGLKNISTILREKSNLSFSNPETDSMGGDNASGLLNGSDLQNITRSELKAEVLLTSLFREKLYAKSQEIEQLQAEVATSVRGIDMLKCEVQNARDSFSAVTHRMKELELQMIKKDEKIHQLQSDFEERTTELMMTRGILPKVTKERDMIWEEVQHHTEKNMLLNSEVNLLKKKIESLEEELLFKEGEATILRDTLGSKSFDLLGSPDRNCEF